MFNTGPNLTAKGQQFLSALTVVMVLVLASTLADQLLNAFPFRFGEVEWRFSAFGMLLAATPNILAQLAIVMVLGAINGSRLTVRRSLGGMIFLAALCVVLLPFFLLDFTQARIRIPITSRHNFDLATLKTTVSAGLLALAMGWAGWHGWSATPKPLSGIVREKGDGLVVGR